jgi:hypothetical protein
MLKIAPLDLHGSMDFFQESEILAMLKIAPLDLHGSMDFFQESEIVQESSHP